MGVYGRGGVRGHGAAAAVAAGAIEQAAKEMTCTRARQSQR